MNAWTDLRRRNLLIRLVALSFPPGAVILIAVISTLADGLSWLAVLFRACAYRRGFCCPRCQQHFLTEALSTVAPCAAVVTSLCGPAGALNMPPKRKVMTRKLVLIGKHARHEMHTSFAASFVLFDQFRFSRIAQTAHLHARNLHRSGHGFGRVSKIDRN